MQIIEVIPIARGISHEKLTYFGPNELTSGSIIEVPLRKKEVPAIVVGSHDALDLKSELRNTKYEIKKISKKKPSAFFLPQFIQSAVKAATYFATSPGSMLAALFPSTIMKNLGAAKFVNHEIITEERAHEKYILQAPDDERIANYKSLIREEFAKKSSVFFMLPTIHDIKNMEARLGKGIEKYTFALHSSRTQKEIVSVLDKLSEEKHPVLILGTGSFLSIPRPDIRAIIIDKHNSQSYKTQARPYIDFRVFAEILSEQTKARLVAGDVFLDVATIQRYKDGEFQELSPLKFRSLSSATDSIVDMRKYKEESKRFRVISDELKQLAESNKTDNEHLYIYSARSGLAPTIICADCGNIVTCAKCGANMVLHASQKGNFFLCHSCGQRKDPSDTCATCGGWRLTSLGIGLDRISADLGNMFPDIKIFVMDKETAPTYKKAKEIASKFYASPGSILVGTEMALPYLDQVENAAIASIDSLFSIPDFRITEKIMSVIIKMRSIAQKRIILQTRIPDEKVFEYGAKGNILDFYKDEIARRKQFNFPPYSVLVKISVEGAKNDTVLKMSRLQARLGSKLDIFPSFIKSKSGKSIMHALLRVPKDKWPDSEIISVVSSLSPEFTVKIDPESLL